MPGTNRTPERTIIIRRKSQFPPTILRRQMGEIVRFERPIASGRLAGAPTAPRSSKSHVSTTPPATTTKLETEAEFLAFQFHPLAEIFPLPADTNLQTLANDIAAHGLRDEITIFQDKILDGRSRYLACKRAGVVPRFESYIGNDPLGVVISRNVQRRHLTKQQRLLTAARAATLPVGANQTTPGLPIGRAAELFQVAERNIARAKAVLRDGTAALIRAVESGKVSISRAAKLAELSPEAQIAALRELAEGKRNPRKKATPKLPKEDIKFDQSDGARAPERSPNAERSSASPGVHDGRRDPKDPGQANEAAYAGLMAAWSQASNSVRIRFIEELMRE